MQKTKIEYLDYSWSPIAMRCTPISPGCAHCWHLRMADRMAKNPNFPEDVRAAYAGKGPPILIESRLQEPLHRKKPTRIGVQFMGDLWHPNISLQQQCAIFRVIRDCPQHTFLMLTKRTGQLDIFNHACGWPVGLDNLWLGVSVEDQTRADERIPILLQTPAALRFISAEPLLGPIDLDGYLGDLIQLSDHQGHLSNGLDWVIVGGESGSGARPMNREWAKLLRTQCEIASIPYFFKQGSAANWTAYKRFDLFPPGLQVREYPNGI